MEQEDRRLWSGCWNRAHDNVEGVTRSSVAACPVLVNALKKKKTALSRAVMFVFIDYIPAQ